MYEDECNILGMDLPFRGLHNDRYSLDVWLDPNPIFIAMPRGDLFSLLSSELSTIFFVSFIMHLMSLSSDTQSRAISLGHLQEFRLESILNIWYLRNNDHYVTRKPFNKDAYMFMLISVKLRREQPKGKALLIKCIGVILLSSLNGLLHA